MSLLPGFNDFEPPPLAARLGPKLRKLAQQQIYFGTSSWKYSGWLGSIYSPERYATRGKFSKAKFEAECLAEYAETFPVVCGDFAFYQFPTDAYWAKLFSSTPETLTFAFKVPEEVTTPKWPTHARYGLRGGSINQDFLNAELFTTHFTRPLAQYRHRVNSLIFEFGTIAKSIIATPADFRARLDSFLSDLPSGWRYSIEIRNPEYLCPEYFALLACHNVAHVYNAWTRMPTLSDQAALEGSFTADFVVARALLAKDRTYETAVTSFEPYDHTQEINFEARSGLVHIANDARKKKKAAFLFVNNRLEGNAPATIEAVVDALD